MFCIYITSISQDNYSDDINLIAGEQITKPLIKYLKDGNLKNLNYMDENGNYKSYYDDIYLKMKADPYKNPKNNQYQLNLRKDMILEIQESTLSDNNKIQNLGYLKFVFSMKIYVGKNLVILLENIFKKN